MTEEFENTFIGFYIAVPGSNPTHYISKSGLIFEYDSRPTENGFDTLEQARQHFDAVYEGLGYTSAVFEYKVFFDPKVFEGLRLENE